MNWLNNNMCCEMVDKDDKTNILIFKTRKFNTWIQQINALPIYHLIQYKIDLILCTSDPDTDRTVSQFYVIT